MNDTNSPLAASQDMIIAIVNTLDKRSISSQHDCYVGSVTAHGVLFYVDTDDGVAWRTDDDSGPVDDDQHALAIVEAAKRVELTYGGCLYDTPTAMREAQVYDYMAVGGTEYLDSADDWRIAADMAADSHLVSGTVAERVAAIAACRTRIRMDEHVSEDA